MPKPRRRPAPSPDIDLHDFSAVGRLFHSSARKYFGTGASYCFRRSRRSGPIVLRLRYERRDDALTVGVHRITAAVKRAFADEPDAAEHGAYGVALLVAATQMRLRFAARSFKGTGFDFFMYAPDAPTDTDDDIFAGTWGLEATGILKGDDTEIKKRLKLKREQVALAAKVRPVLIAVVEFSRPIAIFELRHDDSA